MRTALLTATITVMRTDTATITATTVTEPLDVPAPERRDRTLLHLIWLASPALPVGAFSYSEGLEAAVEGRHVIGEAGAARWLLDHLALVLARAELPVAAAALAAWRAGDVERIAALNDWMRQTRESAEMRQQGEQMARALVEWLRNGGSGRSSDAQEVAAATQALAALRPAPSWPVAFALAAAPGGASAHEVLLACAFGWAENAVQAAMKTVPLGQAAAQRILAQLAGAIPGAVEHALALPEDARQAATPMLAILSAQHELQYSRLFRS